MNTTHWRNDDICYMTISTFFWTGCAIGLIMDNISIIYMFFKKGNEEEHKHRENVEKR